MHPFLIFLIVLLPIRSYARRIGAWSFGACFLAIISIVAYFQGNMEACILFAGLCLWRADASMKQFGYVD